MKKLLLAAALSVATTSVFAQSFYVGGSIGMAQNKLWSHPDNQEFIQDKRDTAIKGFVGYNINKTFALEASYTDLGKNKSEYNDGVFGGTSDSKFNATTLALKTNITTINQLTPFVKLGVTRLTNKEAVNDGLTIDNYKTTKSNLYWSIGTDYELTKQFSLRAEYENYGKAGTFDTNTDTSTGVKSSALSLGIVYKF